MVNYRELQTSKVYSCELRHCTTKEIVKADLIYVGEDDCDWRTADDDSEISYSWDIISAKEKV